MTTTMERTLFAILFTALAATRLLPAAESMSVSPSEVTLRGDVGQTTTQTLSFTNNTSRSLSFAMIAQDAVVRDGKRSYVEAGTQPGSIAATAAFSPNAFTAAPGETVSINVTVTIPPRSAVRAVAIMCSGTTEFARGPMRMTASIGTLLTFALTGDEIAGTVSPLLIHLPTASSNFVAVQQVANSGTEPIVASGMLVILNAAGALIGKQAIPGWRMLPGEQTDIRVQYDGNLASGRYQALTTYDLTEKTLTSTAEFTVN
ncbi:MAG: hypothetical protein QOI24_2064 [Acidobacteriota bacterium]|jgi:hypothetical protein|nr:hypothetical protein [Acidobacteriota bacterium]